LFAKSNEGKEWKIESKPNYREIFNDINGDLINFWRYIKYHPEAFHKELEQYMASRELFKEMIEQKPRTDLERAVLFYYKLSCSFGGLSRSFALRGGSNIIPLFNEEKVRKASERLKNVVIDNLSFEKIITKYDRDFTFFYVDPPYYDKEDVYDRDSIDVFTQHKELRKLLGKVKGKWLLSYNDHPQVREMYKDYDIQEAETLYSLSGKTIPKTEILIKNY
jgi:DNA adenine methylase